MTSFESAMQVRDYLATFGLHASHIEMVPGRLVRFEFRTMADAYIAETMNALRYTELPCYYEAMYSVDRNGRGVLTYTRSAA